MSDVATLKSYLVSLGFQVDAPSLGQFSKVLGDTAHLVEGSTASIVVNIAKWTSGIITLFTAVSAATLTAMDKVAMADQEYRLFGERMFMDTAHAKALKVALDALGEPLEAIAFDPELHARFDRLIEVQKQLAAGLGPGFESSMKSIRDVRFELTLLEVELEYITQGAVAELFKQLGLGDGSVLGALRAINAWVVQHAPEISRAFASYIVPVLKDTWMIVKDLGRLFGVLAMGFSNFIGIVSGDHSLESKTFSFDKFARALDKCINFLARLVDGIIRLATVLGPIQGTLTGVVLGGLFGGLPGAAIGGAAGVVYDIAKAVGGNQAASDAVGQLPAGSAVDPSLIAAIASVESGGRQTDASGRIITSSKGALGIMQLMPDTARQLGVNPLDATQNLAGGSKLFGQLYAKYGDIQLALAAYNWGSGNVDKAIKNHSSLTSTLQSLPAETQNYVASVMSKYQRGRGGRFTPNTAGASIDNSVSIGDIHITQPNASSEEISSMLLYKVRQMQRMQTQRNLAELTTVYG